MAGIRTEQSSPELTLRDADSSAIAFRKPSYTLKCPIGERLQGF